jgi:hypothetical protein
MDVENGAPPNGRNGTMSSRKARKDIGKVFEVWQAAHGPYDKSPPPDLPSEELASRIRQLGKDEPAQLALASCWSGFAEKVRLSW